MVKDLEMTQIRNEDGMYFRFAKAIAFIIFFSGKLYHHLSCKSVDKN